ncbi:MAG: ABC transporter ATP-binding protein [Deltaproteobacteria bacterium]|jgi:iron complex transport system ATP-binding protein|nr:ABC transporter ATP-binding protein [Deltaproteobacteria bacterium]
MLEIKNVCFRYKKDRPVLSDVSFELERGEILGIVGPNGTGKTTLLKTINKLLVPQSGQITFDGLDMLKVTVRESAKLMAYVPQYATSFFPVKVVDCVMMGRVPHSGRKYTKKDKDIVFAVIEKTNLADFAFRNMKEISGGERQLVLIARAMAQQPRIIILDEPTGSLDLKNQLFILNTIADMAKNENYSIIMTMHDLNLASMFCDKLLMLKNREVFARGNPRDVLTEENIAAIYGVKTRVTLEDGDKHVRLLK